MKALAIFLGFSCAQTGFAHPRAVEDRLVSRTASRLAEEGLKTIPYTARVTNNGSSYIVQFSNTAGKCFYTARYDQATLQLESAFVSFAQAQAAAG
jgi:hypothetical protein